MFVTCAIGVTPQHHPYQYLELFSLCVLLLVSCFWVFQLGLWFTLSSFRYMRKWRYLDSFACIWIFSFFKTIYWKHYFFYNEKPQFNTCLTASTWVFYSILLAYVSVFMLTPRYFGFYIFVLFWSQVLWCLLLYGAMKILELLFSIYVKIIIDILMKIALNPFVALDSGSISIVLIF